MSRASFIFHFFGVEFQSILFLLDARRADNPARSRPKWTPRLFGSTPNELLHFA